MIRIKSIDNIISELVGEKEMKRMRDEFFKFAKKGKIMKSKWTALQKLEHDKYDLKTNEIKNLKDSFFEKLQNSGIYFCCYCGKDRLTHFKEGGKDTKRLYDIEHFLPRSKFPDLSVNLYNWLPVCISCNQRLKGAKNPLEKGEVFHPYFGFLNSKGEIINAKISVEKKFTFYGKSLKNKVQIFNSKHSDFFKLSQIYLNSQDTFNTFDFIQSKRINAKDLKRFFPNISESKLKNYFFESYYPKNEDDILKYGNGKLKKDLIKNLKI